jgi:hypothetical protein
MTVIAGKEVSTPDLALLGTGVVVLIDSFLPWYHVSFGGFGSASIKGWSSGFWAWFGILLLLVVAGIVVARIFADFALPKTDVAGPALILLAVSALGTLSILLRFLTETSYAYFGLWIGLIAGLVQVFFLFQAFQGSGEKMPDFSKRGPTSEPPVPPTA